MGKEYLKGLKDGLGGKIPIVAEAPYKVTDTNIDAQIAKLKASERRCPHAVHHAEIRDHGDQAKSPNSAGGRTSSSRRSPIPIRR